MLVKSGLGVSLKTTSQSEGLASGYTARDNQEEYQLHITTYKASSGSSSSNSTFVERAEESCHITLTSKCKMWADPFLLLPCAHRQPVLHLATKEIGLPSMVLQSKPDNQMWLFLPTKHCYCGDGTVQVCTGQLLHSDQRNLKGELIMALQLAGSFPTSFYLIPLCSSTYVNDCLKQGYAEHESEVLDQCVSDTQLCFLVVWY